MRRVVVLRFVPPPPALGVLEASVDFHRPKGTPPCARERAMCTFFPLNNPKPERALLEEAGDLEQEEGRDDGRRLLCQEKVTTRFPIHTTCIVPSTTIA